MNIRNSESMLQTFTVSIEEQRAIQADSLTCRFQKHEQDIELITACYEGK